MKTFEYKVITEPQNLGISTLQKHFTDLGKDGWELCGILGLTFIFKRESRSLLLQ